MTEVVVDAAVREFLSKLKTEEKLVNEDGTVLGIFTPKEIDRKRREEQIKSMFDLEEAERIVARNAKGYSIEEVLAHLKSLEPQQ